MSNSRDYGWVVFIFLFVLGVFLGGKLREVVEEQIRKATHEEQMRNNRSYRWRHYLKVAWRQLSNVSIFRKIFAILSTIGTISGAILGTIEIYQRFF